MIGRFFTESAACNFVRGKDVMGTDGKVQRVDAMVIGSKDCRVLGPVVGVMNDETDIERLAALSKLTAKERALLGLS